VDLDRDSNFFLFARTGLGFSYIFRLYSNVYFFLRLGIITFARSSSHFLLCINWVYSGKDCSKDSFLSKLVGSRSRSNKSFGSGNVTHIYEDPDKIQCFRASSNETFYGGSLNKLNFFYTIFHLLYIPYTPTI
jgi:hypothetical protein